MLPDTVLLTVKLPAPAPPIGGYPPVFWTEVFSRPDGRWMPVDPIRCMVNKRKVFEPPAHDKSNRMVYVVAIEEDGYGRDVTPRYAREYGAKTTKVQLGGKGKKEWWEQVMVQVTRPFRLVSRLIMNRCISHRRRVSLKHKFRTEMTSRTRSSNFINLQKACLRLLQGLKTIPCE